MGVQAGTDAQHSEYADVAVGEWQPTVQYCRRSAWTCSSGTPPNRNGASLVPRCSTAGALISHAYGASQDTAGHRVCRPFVLVCKLAVTMHGNWGLSQTLLCGLVMGCPPLNRLVT